MFDRGGGEGRAGGGGGGRTNIGWRRGERRRGGGGTGSRLQRLLWKYFSNCRRKRIDHCRAPKQTFTRLRQYGMEKWQTHWHPEFCTVAQKKTPKKRNGKSTGTLQSVLIPKYLGLLCRSCANFKCVFFGASADTI